MYYCRGEGHEPNHCHFQHQLVQCVYCEWYQAGCGTAHYPVPAIPLQVVWPDGMNYSSYADMIYIDSIQTGEDDPVMVCCWDFHHTCPDEWRGKYQPCYIDVQVDWYKKHGAWNNA